MAKILTGVQSTGTPHLGNLLAIIPAIALSNKPKTNLSFIADLHSITQIKQKHYELTPTVQLRHGSLAD
jgi:tryptophanyl-tRNA synthetase